MENILIVLILVLFISVGVYYAVQHFKGKGGCCGGGSYRPKRKKLKHIQYQKTFLVQGMHCNHCKARVEETVNDIKGVAGKVNLKKGELTVFYAENADDEMIKRKIEKAGYCVKEIK